MASTSASTSVLPKLSAHGLLSNAGGLASRCSPHVVSLPALRCRLDQPCVSSTSSTRLGKRRGRVIAMATGETSTDPAKPLTDALKPLQEAWEKTDDKLAVGGLGFAAVIVLWASTGLIALCPHVKQQINDVLPYDNIEFSIQAIGNMNHHG